jgi:tRNA(Ile)-lysidine synthase
MLRVAKFLAKHWDGHRPLLLGYSGGPDSKALLYSLLEAGCTRLHLAHVDHGWRSVSGQEALELEEEAKSLGLPFHSIRLNLPKEANREAASRESRFAFFRTLFEKIPFQALLLAHQAGDAAETALKRVLEGAHLPFLGGSMEPATRIGGIDLWRPLLSVKKEEILAFLSLKNLTPLIDPTNYDPAYLRARMRTEILPSLARAFGKEISDNLLLLSSRAAELKAYLEKKTAKYPQEKGPWGFFASFANLERVEARYLLQKWGESEKVKLSRTLLEKALDALSSNLPNRRIAPRLFVDRGHVFFLSAALPSWGPDPLPLSLGSWVWGDWIIDVKERGSEPFFESGWKEVWSGSFTVRAPRGWLSMPPSGSRLRRLWNERKVPAIFRSLVPVVSNERGEMKEFLTGKNLPEIDPFFTLVISSRSLPTP